MEGHNTLIDTRWAAPGDTQSMQRFAKELVALQECDEIAPSHKLASGEARNLAHRWTTWVPVHRSEIRLLMAVQGQTRAWRHVRVESVLLPTSDIGRRPRDGSFVPFPDEVQCSAKLWARRARGRRSGTGKRGSVSAGSEVV